MVSIAFAACNSGTANYKESTTSPSSPISVPAVPVTVVADTKKKLPVTTTVQVPPVTTSSAQTKTTTTTTTALNPSHGQPGHRCDIAEGAPLNSAPVTSTNIPAGNKNVVVNPQVQSQPGKTNVKLNPAHGLPGHDCTIGVGQPLKS